MYLTSPPLGAFGATFGRFRCNLWAPAAPPLGNLRLRRPRWGGCGAPVGVAAAPIWETSAFGGGQRKKKLGCHGRPITYQFTQSMNNHPMLCVTFSYALVPLKVVRRQIIVSPKTGRFSVFTRFLSRIQKQLKSSMRKCNMVCVLEFFLVNDMHGI